MKRRATSKPGKRSQTLKPKRLLMEDNPPPEPFEAWRMGSFFFLHSPDPGLSMIVDLDEQTFIRHVGHIDTVIAMLNALQNLRFQGDYLYPTEVFDLSDEEFLDIAMPVMDTLSALDYEDNVPDVDPDTLINMVRSTIIDDLLKKPDKKN